MNLPSLRERGPPFAAIEIAAAEPHQCQDFDPLLVIERIERRGELLLDRVVGSCLQDSDLIVVARIRTRVGVDRRRFGIEGSRLLDNVGKLHRWNVKHRESPKSFAHRLTACAVPTLICLSRRSFHEGQCR